MTQNSLLETAIVEFGAKGLEGASTREIAAKAGTAMSSITYHFGGKEGLYRAAAEHIAGRMADVAADLPIAEAVASGDRTEARRLIKELLSRIVDKASRSQHESLFIVREQMNPTEAFDCIYGGPLGRVWQRMAQLVGIATGNQDTRLCRIVTMTLFGQAISMRAARAAFERLVETSLEDRDLLDQVKTVINANADAILDRHSDNPENAA